jgi:hypothetical protein
MVANRNCVAFLVSSLMVAIALGEVDENCNANNGVCTGPSIEYKDRCTFMKYHLVKQAYRRLFLTLRVFVTVPIGSIYMAPSSVKGLNGMGIFTTEAMTARDELLSEYDGPSIPVLDPRRSDRDSEELAEQRKRWIELFDGYWWGRGVPDHTRYEANSVLDLQITFGALPNHHCALNAIAYTFQPPNYDDGMVDPDSSPGIGAFSYHNGRTFHVQVRYRDVQRVRDQRKGVRQVVWFGFAWCSQNGVLTRKLTDLFSYRETLSQDLSSFSTMATAVERCSIPSGPSLYPCETTLVELHRTQCVFGTRSKET